MDLKTTPNFNITCYFINTLASPHDYTWHSRGDPITQIINHFVLYPNHWRSVGHIWKIVISSIEQGGNYTGINVTKNYVRPYLLYSSYEINMRPNSMQISPGVRYTKLLIKCRH